MRKQASDKAFETLLGFGKDPAIKAYGLSENQKRVGYTARKPLPTTNPNLLRTFNPPPKQRTHADEIFSSHDELVRLNTAKQ